MRTLTMTARELDDFLTRELMQYELAEIRDQQERRQASRGPICPGCGHPFPGQQTPDQCCGTCVAEDASRGE